MNTVTTVLVSAVVSAGVVMGSLYFQGTTGGEKEASLQVCKRHGGEEVMYLSAGETIPDRDHSPGSGMGLSPDHLLLYPTGTPDDNIHARFSVVF
ncbi:hypothetical protein AS413_23170 [Salmonella enterica subsp. enterica serovar Baildon]|nr:hypothetical protein [Salmonella enterica subsp. enterica serovar Richmond]EBV8115681.1 hypothetical protein [Salmonella enterica subsp. enterica serovar Baildon]ECE7678369.1 hypothetical protein [Salmonella enterica subsp. enterica serovar Richmond]